MLWGTWLLAFVFTFSVSTSINSYYLAALSPPIAAWWGPVPSCCGPVGTPSGPDFVPWSCYWARWLIKPAAAPRRPGRRACRRVAGEPAGAGLLGALEAISSCMFCTV